MIVSKKIFYKVTDFKEINNGYIYKDGLNILDKPFERYGSCVPGGLYFTTLEHIHKFYNYGCYLREVILPIENPEFKIILDPDENTYRANMIILGQKYSLSNTETYKTLGLSSPTNEKLMEIASREGLLETLKLLHNNDTQNSNIYICKYAAKNGHLEILKWARKNGYPWNSMTCSNAALNGHLQVLKWAFENGCDWDETTCSNAALNGHLKVLKWAYNKGCAWNSQTSSNAALNGHLNVLKWTHKKRFPWGSTCSNAALNGHLEVLKWARVNMCPWDGDTCSNAALNGHLEVLKWVREQKDKCPWYWNTCFNAIVNGHLEILKFAKNLFQHVLQRCDSTGYVKKTYNDLRICYFAVKYGDIELLKWALENGCKWDKTAYKCAVIYRQSEILKWARENGCKCGIYN